MNFHIKTIAEWDVLATQIARDLEQGMVLALSGPLGAGKTTFVQALTRALGSSANPRSPTFSLLRTYQINVDNSSITRLVHVDAYRLEKSTDVIALNLDEELAEPGTIIVIEWPENVSKWLESKKSSTISLEISVEKDQTRTVQEIRRKGDTSEGRMPCAPTFDVT